MSRMNKQRMIDKLQKKEKILKAYFRGEIYLSNEEAEYLMKSCEMIREDIHRIDDYLFKRMCKEGLFNVQYNNK